MTPPPDTIYVIRHGEKPADPPDPAGQAAAAPAAAAKRLTFFSDAVVASGRPDGTLSRL